MAFNILLLLFIIICNSQTVYGHDSKSSLTFVIDETGSMADDIDEVKSQSRKLFSEVLNKESSNIGEVSLVTFGDDYAKLRATTKDCDVFLRALEEVTASGGDDCPEGSMSGILLGLEKSANNSFMYVFTDASAKDYLMYEEVKRLSQKKSIQVNFLLTGLCKGDSNADAYLVYHKMAAATSGQVLYIKDKKNLHKVLDFIIESMKNKKVLLVKKVFTSGTNHIIFNTDSHIHNVLISMSIFGKDENWEDNILIADSEGNEIRYDILVDIDIVKVLTIPFLKPGSYKVTFKIYYKTSVFISAATDICFQHGFSESKPTSIKETSTQPNLGSESYLSIALTNVARDVELNEAELIDENDNVIMKVPLKLVDSGKQLYITETLDPPKKMFKVVINGHTLTKEHIRREGATYIESLKLTTIPVIDKIKKVYTFKKGSTPKVSCRVIKGYPKPNISWTFKNKHATDFQSLESKDSTNSIDTPEEGEYRCQAKNNAGEDFHSMDVTFENEIPEIDKIEKMYKFKKGSKAEVTCRIIKGYPKPTLSWSYKNKLATDFQALGSKDETITIDSPEEGEYRCQAQNVAGEDSHSMEIIFEDEIPEIDKTEKVYTLKKGSKLELNCRIIKGYPKPTFSWSYKNKLATDFRALGSKDETITIDTPQEGEYRCQAQNVAGQDSHSMEIVFKDEIPDIDKTEKVYKLKKGSKLELNCRIIKGYPKPTFSWSYKNKLATDFQVLGSKDETISIDTPEEGEYRCQAQNVAGEDSHSIDVTYENEIPEIDKTEKVYKFKKGSKVELNCRIIKGYPKPTFSWSYKNKLSSDFQALGSKDENISIDTPEEGEYRCQAQNVAGEDSHSMKIMFEDEIPEIDKTEKVYKFKKRSKLELNCRIIKGYPKPTLSWSYKNKLATDFQVLSSKDETISIDTPEEGEYRCQAKNAAGEDSHSMEIVFEVFLDEIPKIDKTEMVYKLKKGSKVELNCRIIKGYPKPTFSWSYKNKLASDFQALGSKDQTVSIDIPEEGEYRCQAKNAAGEDSHSMEIVFEDEIPEIDKTEKVYKLKKGSKVEFNCRIIKGYPEPTLSWSYKNKLATDFQVLGSRDETISIDTPEEGEYRCQAENVAGVDFHTMDIVFEDEIPEIDKTQKIHKLKKGSKVELNCRIIKGFPKPNVSWSYKNKLATDFQALSSNDETISLDTPEEGEYRCQAENVAGVDFHTMDIVFEDEIPEIYKTQKIYKLKKGSKVEINCRIIKGNPEPTLSWSYKNKLATDFQVLGSKDETISIDTPEEGEYRCQAENVAGVDFHTMDIVFEDEIPEIDKTEKVYKLKKGSKVEFNCRIIKGYPKPTLSWSYKNKLATDFQVLGSKDETISIDTPEEGEYRCQAKNVAGEDSHSMEIVFEDEIPEIDKTQKVHTFKKGSKSELTCSQTALTVFRKYGPNGERCLGKSQMNLINTFSLEADHLIIKGYPKPTLSWSFKNKFAKDYQLLDNTDETILIDEYLGGGKYRCQAENIAGKDSHSVAVVFEGPPEIKSLGREISVSIAETVNIPCFVDGMPPSDVLWLKDLVQLYNGKKYQIFGDHTLRFFTNLDTRNARLRLIDRPNKYDENLFMCMQFIADLNDSGDYICAARNTFGVEYRTFKVNVYDPVKIEIPNETLIKILVGSLLKLSCTSSGSPELNIQFIHHSTTSDPKVVKEKKCLNHRCTLEHSVNYIQEVYGGYYTCHASNAYSSKTLIYTVVVQEPPTIISHLNDRDIYAVEGDVALQIPCEALGNPKPTISWSVNGKHFVSGKAGVQKENILVLNNLKLYSSGTYTCFAENGIGPRQSKTYNLQVEPYPRVSGKISKTLLVDVQKGVIKCGIPYGSGDLVRWFKDGQLINQNTGELPIDNVITSDAGIYTCRVSNHIVAQSYHTEVLVGNKPKFSTSISKQPIEYKEGAEAYLDCNAEGHPKPKIKWTLDGHKIYVPSMLYIISNMKIKHVGVYTCNVTNDFGWITRSFQIKAEECQLSIARDFNGNQPMITTSSLKFPSLQTINGFVMVPMKPMFLICPTGKFNYPGLDQRTKITITCIKDSLFDVQGKKIKFSDLKCKNKVEPYIRKNNIRCIDTKSELYSIGYKLDTKFVAVYDICFDKKKNIPVFAMYSLHKDISNTLPSVEPALMMSPDTYHFDEFYDRSQQVNRLSSILGQPYERDSCYFSQRQLVNSRDMFVGTAQTSTYSYLNIFPHYSTCYKENWDVVESKLRHAALSLDFNLVVWAGTSHLMRSPSDGVNVTLRNSRNQAQFVPLYLWKVVESKELRGSIAIIQINLPNLTLPEALKYVICKDICDEIEWLRHNEWHNVKKGYTYCCGIEDFEKAFKFQRLFNFGSPKVLKTISNVKKTKY